MAQTRLSNNQVQASGSFFHSLSCGKEVPVREVHEAVWKEFTHVGNDLGRTTTDIVGDDAASDGPKMDPLGGVTGSQ
jgi:hypothetical protein